MAKLIEMKGLPELQRRLKELIKGIRNPRSFFGEASIIMFKDIMDHFDKEEGPKGKWKPLQRATLISRRVGAKLRGGVKILQSSGNLKGKIRPIFTNTKAETGLTLKYANIHQEGGTIPARYVRPIKKKALHWVSAAAGGEVHHFSRGHSIPETKIPARPFLWYSREAENRILGSFMLHLKRSM